SFTQADATIINRYGGTGLGLAICRRITETLGGEISVQSAPGQGSSFRVVLPVAAAAAEEAEAPPPAGAHVVVLARDAAALAERLSADGWVFRPAASLAEAVAQLQSLPAGEPRLLVAAPEGLGLAPGELLQSLAVLDPAGAWRCILLASDAPVGMPAATLRRHAFALLPSDAPVEELRRSLAVALAVGAAVASDEEAADEASAAEEERKGPPVSVLVADDNRVNRRVLQRILESAGHRVTLVTNGEEALEALEAGRFDLVLLDLNMPVLDGIETARMYRFQSLGQRRVPILALTADATPEARQRALEAGMDGCLTKPVTPEALLAAVRAHALTDGAAAAAAEAGPVAPIASHPRFRPSGLPPLDEGALADLEALGGPEFVAGVVADFLSDAEQLIRELGEAAARGDSATFRARAHALRSAGANVGARTLCELCRTGQAVSPAELRQNGQQQVERLAAELSRVRQALSRHLGAAAARRG
ncbi:MAG: response regulator, partial [Rhodovarius sp.]|nr:response regulator [Rhodovarius sp.]